MNIIICAISFILLVIGIFLTVTGFKKDDFDKEPQVLIDHKNQLKIIGPIMIVLSLCLFFVCFRSYMINTSTYSTINATQDSGAVSTKFGFDNDDQDSSFGFKFY